MKRNKVCVSVLLILLLIAGTMAGCSKPAPAEAPAPAPESPYLAITTEDLQKNLETEGWVVVDTRLNDAFNGWALDGVAGAAISKGRLIFQPTG